MKEPETRMQRLRWWWEDYGRRRVNDFIRPQWFYDLRQGIANFVAWAPTVWRLRYWDVDWSLGVFEKHLRMMAGKIEKHGSHLYRDRDVRRMRTAAALLKRIGEESVYCPEHEEMPTFWAKDRRFKKYDRNPGMDGRQRDLDYLCIFLRKRALGWWD